MEREGELGPFYTIQEAAKLLRVSEGTVWRWVRDQKLPAYRVGDRAIRIKKEDLPSVIKKTDMGARTMERAITLDKEQQLLVLKQAEALRAKIESRVGKPLPSSVQEIQALREERARRAS